MDAKEIREVDIHGSGTYGMLEILALFVREWTAQLAELNATLREEVNQDAIEEVTSSKPAQTEHKCDRSCAYLGCPPTIERS